MSGSFRRAFAGMLARQLLRAVPPSRAIWAEAMQRELTEIENPSIALRFAAGCLWACSVERLRSLDLILRIARRGIVAGTASFGALALIVGIRLFPAHGSSAFGAIAIAFGTASMLLWRRGPASSASVAAVMLTISALAFANWPVTAQEAQSALYRALALEGMILWSLLLAGNLALAWATHSAWLRNRASESGWA